VGTVPTTADHPIILLVMGVSGSGKTTVGTKVAERLGWAYAEADDFHPPANVAKMAAHLPLDDTDREPWLAAIGAWIDQATAAATPAVVTCSALKRAYRDKLRTGRRNVRLVYLEVDQGAVAARLASRKDHFFPSDLLASQFRDLEPPAADEHAIRVHADVTPDQMVDRLLAAGVAEA
jgi:gluconokinase